MIAQKIQAMHNFALTNPPITVNNFIHTMQAWEKLNEKLVMMVPTINLNMGKCKEATTDTLKVQTTSITMVMEAMAMKFQLSNQHLQVIAQSLDATLPRLPTHNHLIATRHVQWRNTTSTPSPSRFHNPPPINNNNQGYNIPWKALL